MNSFHTKIAGQVFTRKSWNYYTYVIVVDHSSERKYPGYDGQLHEGQHAEQYRKGQLPRWGVWSWVRSPELADKAASKARKIFKTVSIMDAVPGYPMVTMEKAVS